MKRNVLIICLLILTLLCGCGFSQNTADPAAAESAAPENAAVTPEETPEPEPTPTPERPDACGRRENGGAAEADAGAGDS